MTGQAAGGGAAGSGGGGQGQGGGAGAGTGGGGSDSILSGGQNGSAAGGSSGQGAGGAGAGQGQGAGAGASGAGGSSSGSGQGQGQGQGAAPGAGSAWQWAEGVAGTGERPAWFKGEKFASVDKQAEAYTALEAKLGPAAALIGAPEGDYAVPALPQGMTGEVDANDPLLVGFSKVAKDMGLSQKAYEQVVQAMRGVIDSQAQAESARLSEAISQLGANLPARVAAVQTYVTQHLGAEAFTALDAAVGTDAAAFQALERLVAKASGDAQLANEGGGAGAGFTKAEIEAERYKVFPEGHQLAGKRMYDHDQAHRARVDGMWKKLFPGEDRQAVG